MTSRNKSAVYVAAAGSLALLLATSAFAEERHRDETSRHNRENGETRTWNRDDTTRNNNTPRENQRENRTFEQRDNGNRTQEQRDNRTNVQRDNRTYEQRDNRTFEQRDNRTNVQRDNRTFEQQRTYEQRNNNDRRGSYDARRNDNRDYRGSGSAHRESYRNGIPRSDGRITMLGRVNRYEHERGGYRIWVGGSAYPYWVPESYFRSRRIGIGLDLRLGGIFRNGAVYVDVLGWPGDPYYNDPYYNDGYYADSYGAYDNGYIRGIVDGVDYRTQLLYVRDDYSGRIVTVDMRRVDRRYSRLDLGDLRRGDRVSLNGEWIRGGLFAADRIDSIGAY